jgi:hypothetical protein
MRERKLGIFEGRRNFDRNLEKNILALQMDRAIITGAKGQESLRQLVPIWNPAIASQS